MPRRRHGGCSALYSSHGHKNYPRLPPSRVVQLHKVGRPGPWATSSANGLLSAVQVRQSLADLQRPPPRVDQAWLAAQTERMPRKIACPAGHKMIVPDDRAGQPLTCPRCGERFVAASVGDEEPTGPVKVEAESAGDVAAPPVAAAPASARLPVIHATPRSVSKSHWQPAARALAAARGAAALFSAAPVGFEIAEAIRLRDLDGGVSPPRWALVLSLIAMLQAAYGAYLWQLCDWASARVVAVALVGLAGIHADGLAIVLLADPRGWIAGDGGLQFAAELAGGRAALWCVCLVSLCTLLALFAGWLSARWRRAEIVFRRTGQR